MVQPFKTPYCNRHCQPLLKCPPGSHISSTRRSCVWHGRDTGISRPKSTPGLLSSILGTSTALPPPTYDRPIGPEEFRHERPIGPEEFRHERPIGPELPPERLEDMANARRAALADFAAERSGSEEFGGGARRRRRSSYGRRRRRSSSRTRSGRRRRRSSSRYRPRRRRRSRYLHGGGYF